MESEDNTTTIQPINLKKDSKIEFRVTQVAKKMVLSRAESLGYKLSDYLHNLIEKDLEDEAKALRLAQQKKLEEQEKNKKEYAEYDKKLKHKKGDFTIDETQKIRDSKKDNTALGALGITIILIILYFVIKWFYNRSQRVNYNRQLLGWYSPANVLPNQAESYIEPKDKIDLDA